MTTDERIADVGSPTADEATILEAIAAGPLTDEICNSVWRDATWVTVAVASAILAQSHVGISRGALILFARVAGAHRLAEALNTVECLVVARRCLIDAMGDGPPLPELQQALDALRAADNALDRLIYNRDLGPPAPLRVWY